MVVKIILLVNSVIFGFRFTSPSIISRGFPKVDHSGIDARIVLEQNNWINWINTCPDSSVGKKAWDCTQEVRLEVALLGEFILL